ncbi:HD-GYP domain-containing protein (plasmid) [Agrobacterium rosae]|uniref:HD-GYP domain-containing protein n=1 Tax=Agrobacterium rosae TaxID=1972867 RepID=UPI00387B7736
MIIRILAAAVGLTAARDAIPLSGRIVAIADNFDALTTARPYKDAWSVERTVAHIRNNAGSQFDPLCVLAFDKASPSILEIIDNDRRESELAGNEVCTAIHAGCAQSADLYQCCRRAIGEARAEKSLAVA